MPQRPPLPPPPRPKAKSSEPEVSFDVVFPEPPTGRTSAEFAAWQALARSFETCSKPGQLDVVELARNASQLGDRERELLVRISELLLGLGAGPRD